MRKYAVVSAMLLALMMALTSTVHVWADDEASEKGEKAKQKEMREGDEETEVEDEVEEMEGEDEDDAFTKSFGEEKGDLVSVGRNPYFILEPGWVAEYANEDGDETLVITVKNETKMVDGVETRIVEERESEDGEVKEVSLNYFAISERTNSVYYFGEESHPYKDGKPLGSEGSWEAGVNGAKYGLFMPGTVLLGSRFYQEIAPGEAMDRAEIVSLDATLKTPAKSYIDLLRIKETSPLERGHEHKLYAAGVGLVRDEDLNLISAGIKR